MSQHNEPIALLGLTSRLESELESELELLYPCYIPSASLLVHVQSTHSMSLDVNLAELLSFHRGRRTFESVSCPKRMFGD